MPLAVSLNGDLVPIPPSNGGGGATIANTTNLISGDGNGNGVDSGVVVVTGLINGATIGSGSPGILKMDAQGSDGGDVFTYGGSSGGGNGGDFYAAGGNNPGGGDAGDVITKGADAGGGGGDGGTIDTSGGAADGGNITTSNGGGSIDTTGTGAIELGSATTRTILVGSATVPLTITFPNANGTVALGIGMALGTGWTANADAGDKTSVIPSTADLTTYAAALDLLVAGAGSALLAISQKVKAMEISLSTSELPNA